MNDLKIHVSYLFEIVCGDKLILQTLWDEVPTHYSESSMTISTALTGQTV